VSEKSNIGKRKGIKARGKRVIVIKRKSNSNKERRVIMDEE
jgi:hypothetical protein